MLIIIDEIDETFSYDKDITHKLFWLIFFVQKRGEKHSIFDNEVFEHGLQSKYSIIKNEGFWRHRSAKKWNFEVSPT